jgi:hypothetical protein
MLDQIAAERRDAVQAALTAAFGLTPVQALAPVTGGASGALTYRLEIAGRPYLLRIETARDFFRNPARGFECMRIASDAGVAPTLRHADEVSGVAIMDFITQRPLSELPGGPAALMRELGGLTKRLQGAPAFPPLMDYLPLLAGMLSRIKGSTVLAPGLLDAHQEGFERIREAYRWDPASLVSSHNDPNPRNILYDGERLWLIDWELSFRNDPLVDVAILAEQFQATPEMIEQLLASAFGKAPDAISRARFVLMRQLIRLFYGCLILSMFVSAPRVAPDPSLAAPSVEEFTSAIAGGRLSPASPQTLYTLGKMSLAAFLAGFDCPTFGEALAVAKGG